MNRLSDQAHAQYLFAGDTRSAGGGLLLGNVEMGSFRVYLGVLTPLALSRVGMPRAEERLGKSASIFLHTLFDGVRGGLAVIQEGASPESLGKVLAEAMAKQREVETDGRFRHALHAVRQYRERLCLAFELTLTAAGVIGVGLPPQMRVEQAGRSHGQVGFQAQRPVRIFMQSSFGAREFNLQVA